VDAELASTGNENTENVSTNQDIMQGWKMLVLRYDTIR